MNGGAQRPAPPLLQLAVVATVAAAAYLGWVPMQAGLGALTVLAVLWPPRVPWGAPAVGAVLRRYLPFAVAWLAFLVVYLQAMHAFGHPVPVQPNLREFAAHGTAAPGFALWCLLIVVVAPLAEETLFRGYLWTGFASAAPRWFAHVATAALFGLVHGWDYALPIAVLGAFFGWLRASKGALLPCVVAHATHNALTVLITVLWPGHLELLYPQ
jgi:membrane protease YdiL (CAAX protease family)